MKEVKEINRNYYDVKTYPDDNNKTLTVKYFFPSNPIVKELKKKTDAKYLNVILELMADDGLLSMNSIYATSKCDERDDYNERDAFDVADLKCSYKYHKKMAKKYYRLLNLVDNLRFQIDDLECYHRQKMSNIEADYNRHYLNHEGDIHSHNVIPTK